MNEQQLVRGVSIKKEIHTLKEHKKIFLDHARSQQFRDPERPENGYGRSTSMGDDQNTPMTFKLAGVYPLNLYDDFLVTNWEELTDLYIMRLERRIDDLEKEFNHL